VRPIETASRSTKIERMKRLIGIDVQPWGDSTNNQRLNGATGLLFTPTADHPIIPPLRGLAIYVTTVPSKGPTHRDRSLVDP
jgi:hypothetical protein